MLIFPVSLCIERRSLSSPKSCLILLVLVLLRRLVTYSEISSWPRSQTLPAPDKLSKCVHILQDVEPFGEAVQVTHAYHGETGQPVLIKGQFDLELPVRRSGVLGEYIQDNCGSVKDNDALGLDSNLEIQRVLLCRA